MTDADTTAAGDPLARELVQGARHLAELGLSPGTSGNVSIRVADSIYLSGTGMSMAELETGSLSRLDRTGAHLGGPRPTKEAPIHLALYDRAPEARCVVHLHSTNAVAASCLPPYSAFSALPAVTPYFVMRVGQTPLIPYAAPGAQAHAVAIKDHPSPFRAALMQNHGLVVTDTTVSRAIQAAIELEEACSVLLRLPASGFRSLSDAEAVELATRYNSYWSAGR